MSPGVRPTEAKVREALFSIWGARIEGCRFLDLFAGTGAVGLEALSRGASEVVLVEGEPRTTRQLQQTVEELGLERCYVVQARLPAQSRRVPTGPFDLVFADPPYAMHDYEALLHRLGSRVGEEGEMVIEHASGVVLPRAVDDLEIADERSYGDAAVTSYRRASS